MTDAPSHREREIRALADNVAAIGSSPNRRHEIVIMIRNFLAALSQPAHHGEVIQAENEFAAWVVREAWETEWADPDCDDTICVATIELDLIARQAFRDRLAPQPTEVGGIASPGYEAGLAIWRAGKCGHHFNAECESCCAALEWTNREMDRLRGLAEGRREVEQYRQALLTIDHHAHCHNELFGTPEKALERIASTARTTLERIDGTTSGENGNVG